MQTNKKQTNIKKKFECNKLTQMKRYEIVLRGMITQKLECMCNQ